MGSAMTTPAKVGQIQMRTPETRPLVGVRDVQGEARLGLQKANLIAQVGKSVVDTTLAFVDIKQKTDDANNTAAQKAATAERTNFAASLATQLKIDANTLDENGDRGFEVAEKKYVEHMKAYDETARQKYRFSGAKAESAWLVSKTTEDRVYTDTIKVWSVDAKNEQTKALNEATLLSTRDPNTAKEILAGEVASGLETEGGMQKRLMKWQSNLIQTDMVAATDNLRRGSRYMTADKFDTEADRVASSILMSPIPINPEVQRKLLSDLSDARIDYEDRIMGQRENNAYAGWIIDNADAQASGDPNQIVAVQDRMRDPAAIETYGERNYVQMVKTATAGGTAGFTTDEARVTVSAMTEDVRNGDLQEIDMIEWLLKPENQAALTKEDWKAAYRVAGTVQDPLIKKANADAKYHANMLFVQTEAPSMLSFEAQKEKAANISTAYQVTNAVKDKIAAWHRGEIKGQMPDVRTLVHEEGAKLYYIPDYMRTSSGSTPMNIWEIDINKSLDFSDELFAIDDRKSGKHEDHKKRKAEIESVKSMLRIVPVKPEGM